MRHFPILITFLFNSLVFFTQTPNWQWAKTSKAISYGNAVTTDNVGNVYLTGSYVTTFNLGTYTLTNQLSTGGMSFFAKLDPSGNVLWCKDVSAYGGASRAIALDGNNNIYILGDNMGGTGGPYPNNGTDVVSLYKFDPNGNELWSKCIGGNYYTNSTSLTIDNLGNVIIIGNFAGSYVTFNATTINNSTQPGSHITAFIAKYDPSGNVLWAKNIIGNNNSNPNYSESIPTDITNDNSGNLYLSGWFDYSTLVFGATTLTKTGNLDLFIAKMDSNGNFIWAKNAVGTGDGEARKIGIDNQNNLYLGGDFTSPTLIFGSYTLTNTNVNWYDDDLFIAKYDNNGNALWAKNEDGSSLKAMGVDAAGNLFVSGLLRDSILFGSDKVKNTCFYIAKYDHNGNAVWGKGIKMITSMASCAIPINVNQKPNGDVYVTGSYSAKKIILDQDTLVNSDPTEYSQAFFIGKTNSNYVGIHEYLKNTHLNIFPNPNNGFFIISNKDNLYSEKDFKVTNVIGQEIPFRISTEKEKITIQLLNNKTGIYFVEAQNSLHSTTSKIIIH